MKFGSKTENNKQQGNDEVPSVPFSRLVSLSMTQSWLCLVQPDCFAMKMKKINAPHWMREILRDRAFREALDNVSAAWCGHAPTGERGFGWRLEYLKSDMERLLRSTRNSKTCKLFMLSVTGADYLESTPGGLLMPDVQVFGDADVPMVASRSEFSVNLDLGKYDNVTMEGVRRVLMAGDGCLYGWLNCLDLDGCFRVAMALLVLRQSDRFAEESFKLFRAGFGWSLPELRDTAGNNALWYSRPAYRHYDDTYVDVYVVDYTVAERAPVPAEVYDDYARELIDLGCDPSEEGAYGLSYDDMRASAGIARRTTFERYFPPESEESVHSNFWYLVEWCEWKVNTGHTPVVPLNKIV